MPSRSLANLSARSHSGNLGFRGCGSTAEFLTRGSQQGQKTAGMSSEFFEESEAEYCLEWQSESYLSFLASRSVSLSTSTSASLMGPFTFLVRILPFSLPSRIFTLT